MSSRGGSKIGSEEFIRTSGAKMRIAAHARLRDENLPIQFVVDPKVCPLHREIFTASGLEFDSQPSLNGGAVYYNVTALQRREGTNMTSVTILTGDLYEHFQRWSSDHSEWATRDLWWACKYDQAKYPNAWLLTLYMLDGRIVGYRLCGKDGSTLATDGHTKMSGALLDSAWLDFRI